MGRRMRPEEGIILTFIPNCLLPIAAGAYAFALRGSSPGRWRYAILGLITGLLGLIGSFLGPAFGH